MAPIEIFTGIKFEIHNQLQSGAHVWGCPLYILDPMLQDGKKVPKQCPCAFQGLYVGVSQHHLATAGRTLKLNSGHISDQYSTVICPFGNPFDVDTFSGQKRPGNKFDAEHFS
jgi:hypothetical protein